MKKAQYMLWSWFVGVIIILGTMFYLATTTVPDTAYVGRNALSVIEASERFERNLVQLDIVSEQSKEELLSRAIQRNLLTNSSACTMLIHPVYSEKCRPQKEAVTFNAESAFTSLMRTLPLTYRPEDVNIVVDDNMLEISTSNAAVRQYAYEETPSPAPLDVSEITLSGDSLVSLQDIPNVRCQDTCRVVPALKENVASMSSSYLVPNNLVLVVTDAHRSVAEQYAQLAAYGGDTSMACNPETSTCPHTTGRAIDINLLYVGGETPVNLNQPSTRGTDNSQHELSRRMVRKALCVHGFVNYWREDWHYEFGTGQWEVTRKNNPNGCAYRENDNTNWETVPIWIEVNGELTSSQ